MFQSSINSSIETFIFLGFKSCVNWCNNDPNSNSDGWDCLVCVVYLLDPLKFLLQIIFRIFNLYYDKGFSVYIFLPYNVYIFCLTDAVLYFLFGSMIGKIYGKYHKIKQ